MAAAEVAKSARIGVITCVRLIASNGLGSRETTIVLPGIIILLDVKKDFFINDDLPFGKITKILSGSALSFKPPERSI